MSRRRKNRQARVNRQAFLGRDRPRCTYCGAAVSRKVPINSGPEPRGANGEATYPFTVDHVVPRARGGKDVEDNQTACCEPCNTAKGQDDLVAFINRLGERAAITVEAAAAMQRRAMQASGILGGSNGGPVLQ